MNNYREEYKKETGLNAIIYAGLGKNEMTHAYAEWLEKKMDQTRAYEEARDTVLKTLLDKIDILEKENDRCDTEIRRLRKLVVQTAKGE